MSPHLRLDIDVTIGVNEKITEARAAILGIVRADERFLNAPPAEVVLTTLGDYFVKITLEVWLMVTEKPWLSSLGMAQAVEENRRVILVLRSEERRVGKECRL